MRLPLPALAYPDPPTFTRRGLALQEVGRQFDSVDDLADKITAFINDYDKRAKPFRWTYDGRLLRAA